MERTQEAIEVSNALDEAMIKNIENDSLEERIAHEKRTIYELRKDLEENGYTYSSEEYEQMQDAIGAMLDYVEKLEKELQKMGKQWKELINGVLVPRTGYKGAPEITQEIFDEMIKDAHECLIFENCYFANVTISGKFENASFENCYFSGCKMEDAEFINVSFKNATIYSDMNGVEFSEVSFEGAGIYDSKWKNVMFEQANFFNSDWKHVSTVQDTVTFKDCNFLLADMNTVFLKGSKVEGKMENVDSIHVTMGGATAAEISNHEDMILQTLGKEQGVSIRSQFLGRHHLEHEILPGQFESMDLKKTVSDRRSDLKQQEQKNHRKKPTQVKKH